MNDTVRRVVRKRQAIGEKGIRITSIIIGSEIMSNLGILEKRQDNVARPGFSIPAAVQWHSVASGKRAADINARRECRITIFSTSAGNQVSRRAIELSPIHLGRKSERAQP